MDGWNVDELGAGDVGGAGEFGSLKQDKNLRAAYLAKGEVSWKKDGSIVTCTVCCHSFL